jgi:hypothetical protein
MTSEGGNAPRTVMLGLVPSIYRGSIFKRRQWLIPKIIDKNSFDRIDFDVRLGESHSRTTRSGEDFRQRPEAKSDRPRRGGLESGHRRASKSSTDAQASLSGFSYPDVRFQAIK